MTTPSKSTLGTTPEPQHPHLFNEILAGLILGALAVAWLFSLWQLAPGPLAWVTLRVLGTLSYAALAVATAFGALVASKYSPDWLGRAVQFGWHGLLSGFALLTGSLHGLFLIVDGQYAQSLTAILLPGGSSFKPLEVGLGTLGLYGLMLVYASYVWRDRLRLKPNVWRMIHRLAYPAFIALTLHAGWTGSDPLLPLYLTAIAAVTLTTTLRVLEGLTAKRDALP